MSFNKPVRQVAIVGTGVIGASWAAEYLARGFDVVATDPAPNAEANASMSTMRGSSSRPSGFRPVQAATV
jgi:3-hydroxyacyl-CoA dehydrogenase